MHFDSVTFYNRAIHFLSNGSWAGLGYNEYQPGALWFFVLVAKLAINLKNYDSFLFALILTNIVLIIAHFVFFLRFSHKYAPILFSLLVLAAGPILLFRFELLVSLLVLIAWHLFRRKKYAWSAFALALGTSIKIYPAILFPLLIFEIARKKKWPSMATAVIFFAVGLTLPVLSFIWLGGDFGGLLTSINVHSLKPIEIEGVWGNLIALMNAGFGISFAVTPGFGVYGITSSLGLLSIANLNRLPIAVAIVLLAIIGWVYRKKGYSQVGLAFIVILVFTLLGKVMNPQYLWWFLVFLPFLPLKWFSKTGWFLVYILGFFSLVLTQLIYPIYFDAFINWFRPPIEVNPLLAMLTLRNLFLLIMLGFGLYGLKRSGFERI